MHDKSHRDLEKNKDMNMPGSTGSQGNQSGVRRDDLESSEVGASSGTGGKSSGTPGSSRTGSSSSSDLGSRGSSSSSSSDIERNS
jgi:hypothetical protein